MLRIADIANERGKRGGRDRTPPSRVPFSFSLRAGRLSEGVVVIACVILGVILARGIWFFGRGRVVGEGLDRAFGQALFWKMAKGWTAGGGCLEGFAVV